MPKKPSATASVVIAVPTLDELSKLKAKDQCARFAERAIVSQRAFAEMGKLHHLISAGLKKGQTIYGELRKLGVKDSTISNASYASKMIDLVKAGHITEAQYDGFTFADCFAISRVMGDKSQRKLSGEEVSAVLAAKPETFDTEFASLYDTGLTVDEAVAQSDRQRKRELVRVIQDKIDETLSELDEVLNDLDPDVADTIQLPELDEQSLEETVWNQYHEAVKALLTKAMELRAEAKAAADLAAQQAPQATTAAPVESSEPSAPVAETTQSGSEGVAEEHAEETETPEPSPAPAPAPEVETPTPQASNVEQMPADPDKNLAGLLSALDSVPTDITGMSVEAKKAVFAKIAEVQQAIADMITDEVKQAA